MQGDVSFTPSGSTWQNDYSFFNASGVLRPELPYYVEDLATGERIGPYPSNDDLINWIYLAPPDPVTLQSIGTNTVRIAWTSVPAAQSYRIERREPFVFGSSQWQTRAIIGASGTQFDDSTLVAGAVYDYRVIALRPSLESEPSQQLRTAMGPDADGDGIPDSVEGTGDLDGDEIANYLDIDSDGDGMLDSWELTYGLNPIDAADALSDLEGDGLNNGSEAVAGTSPKDADTDKDGTIDVNDTAPGGGTGTPVIALAPVLNVKTRHNAGKEIIIEWTYGSQRAQAYELERAIEGEAWMPIATLASSVPRYVDKQVEVDVRYYYRLKGVNGTQRSEPSNEATLRLYTARANAMCVDYYSSSPSSPSGSVRFDINEVTNPWIYRPISDPEPEGPEGIHELFVEKVVAEGTAHSFAYNFKTVINLHAGTIVFDDQYRSDLSASTYLKGGGGFAFTMDDTSDPETYSVEDLGPSGDGDHDWRLTWTHQNLGPFYIVKTTMGVYTGAGLSSLGRPAPLYDAQFIPYSPNSDHDDQLPNGAPDNSDDVMGPKDNDFVRVVLRLSPTSIPEGLASFSFPVGLRVFDETGNKLTPVTLLGVNWLSMDYSDPTGPLAGLKNGAVTLYIENATDAADPVYITFMFQSAWSYTIDYVSAALTPIEVRIMKPQTTANAEWQSNDFIQPWIEPLIFNTPENHALKFKMRLPAGVLSEATKEDVEFEVAVRDGDESKQPEWVKLHAKATDIISPDGREIWCTISNQTLRDEIIPQEPFGIEHSSLDWCSDCRSSFGDGDIFDSEASKLTNHTPLIIARGPGNWTPNVSTDEFGQPVRPWTMRSNSHFIIHGGLQFVEVRAQGTNRGERIAFRSQGDWLYLSTHGAHSTSPATGNYPSGALETLDIVPGTSTRVVVLPEQVRWSGDLDVVVIAGCSALDINDYNNNFPNAKTPDPASHFDSPGKRWAQTGPPILLGYNYSGPSDREGGIDIIRAAMPLFQANPVSAWRLANAKYNAWNACAIKEMSDGTKRYYYFDKTNKLFLKLTGIFVSVPESQW
jgi:hypothetical protein